QLPSFFSLTIAGWVFFSDPCFWRLSEKIGLFYLSYVFFCCTVYYTSSGDHKIYFMIQRLLSLSVPHNALALLALACCSDNLAIVCLLSHKEPSVNIYVGNLEFTTTDYDLRQLFEPYGEVDAVRVIIDRDTGRSKGFGFVEMPDSTTAKAAIAGLQGKELAGRTLTVNEAKPREPRREPKRSRW